MARESGPFPLWIRTKPPRRSKSQPTAARLTFLTVAQSIGGAAPEVTLGSGDALELIGCLGVNYPIGTGKSRPTPAGHAAGLTATKLPFTSLSK